jgi:hypothetical protein
MPVDSTTGLPEAGAGFQQVGDQQLVRRNLVEVDERGQLGHRFQIEGRAGKLDFARRTVFGQRRQMFERQFPLGARPMLGALAQNLGREHAVDLEELELHCVAAGIGRGVDECAGAIQITTVIAGGFRDEDGLFHLTKSKERMAKKGLTEWNLDLELA